MNVELTARYRRNGPVYGAGELISLPDQEAQSLIDRGGAKLVKDATEPDDMPAKTMKIPNKMLAPGGKGKPQPDVKLKCG